MPELIPEMPAPPPPPRRAIRLPAPALATLPEATFGVEIEYILGLRGWDHYGAYVEGAMRHNPNFQGVSLGGGGYDRWVFKTDPSCGGEITTPPLTWETASILPEVCGLLIEAGASVNERCGLHVHHRLLVENDKQLRRIYLLWAALEQAISGFLPEVRRHSSFSRTLLDGASWETRRERLTPIRRFRPSVESDTRYRSLNMSHWWRTGRVEIRSYQGTLDGIEMLDWCLFTQLFLHAGREFVRQSVIQRIANGSVAEKYQNLLALVTGYSQHQRVEDLKDTLRSWLRVRNPVQAHFLEAVS